jgi:hypothetical protein
MIVIGHRQAGFSPARKILQVRSTLQLATINPEFFFIFLNEVCFKHRACFLSKTANVQMISAKLGHDILRKVRLLPAGNTPMGHDVCAVCNQPALLSYCTRKNSYSNGSSPQCNLGRCDRCSAKLSIASVSLRALWSWQTSIGLQLAAWHIGTVLSHRAVRPPNRRQLWPSKRGRAAGGTSNKGQRPPGTAWRKLEQHSNIQTA